MMSFNAWRQPVERLNDTKCTKEPVNPYYKFTKLY